MTLPTSQSSYVSGLPWSRTERRELVQLSHSANSFNLHGDVINLSLCSGCFSDPLDFETVHAVEIGLTETGTRMLQDWLRTETLVLGIPWPVFVEDAIFTSRPIIIFCIFLVHCGNIVLYSSQCDVRVALVIYIAVSRFFWIFDTLSSFSVDCFFLTCYCLNFPVRNSGPLPISVLLDLHWLVRTVFRYFVIVPVQYHLSVSTDPSDVELQWLSTLRVATLQTAKNADAISGFAGLPWKFQHGVDVKLSWTGK